MGLRNALEKRSLANWPLPELSATARLAATLLQSTASVLRPALDLDIVADRFLFYLKHGAEPSVSDWNKIAWCLWTTNPAIAEDERALDALLARVARMERKRPYRQLASAYLTDFALDRPRLDRVASVLRAYALVAGDPWSGLHTKLAVFDGASAALGLARFALNEQSNTHDILTSTGINGPLLEAGFAKAVHDEGLKVVQGTAVSSTIEHLKVLQRWSLRPNGSLIFKNCKPAFARAVVQPFGDRIPAPADRDIILNFIARLFGDPRVNVAAWIGIDDVAQILWRWLTEQSLRQFFEVVDRIAPVQAWKYRRAFWQAYHEAGLLRNAWVIFGGDGAAEAKRAFGADVPFGKFKPGGKKQVQQGHAVLLLDLGQCVVADWSYNGYCNIWPIANPNRPKNLNAASYTSDEVRRAVPEDHTEVNLTRHDIFGHGGSENYVWQSRVAGRLQELIGIRIPQTAYRVR
jgi:hypothetical protein